MFVKLHNNTVAQHGAAGGLMQGFAREVGSIAREEYRIAQAEDSAAEREREITLSTNASENSQNQIE
jgi:hypothetical protein